MFRTHRSRKRLIGTLVALAVVAGLVSAPLLSFWLGWPQLGQGYGGQAFIVSVAWIVFIMSVVVTIIFIADGVLPKVDSWVRAGETEQRVKQRRREQSEEMKSLKRQVAALRAELNELKDRVPQPTDTYLQPKYD